jgi:hypothetical protein
VFEPYTERARQVVVLAQEPFPGSEYDAKPLDGARLISVVQEGDAARAILERRRRSASA